MRSLSLDEDLIIREVSTKFDMSSRHCWREVCYQRSLPAEVPA